ncbi:MAG TPA: (d)CMP kinase [Bacteroidales bacterium]|nr:(d)CMP kinase [Bacteroidales bacterium]
MQLTRKLIIAIDGYSSCGKSTFARSIARELNYIYIDSGAMYRAVTLLCLRKKLVGSNSIDEESIIKELGNIHIDFVFNPDNGENETWLNSENVENEIRDLEVTSYVSRISQIPEVRSRMVGMQRQIGALKGIVMDGRDIGTVVFPDADIKIFMTASVEIRAKRRYDELRAKGIDTNLDVIKNGIIARDIADENRDISPLRRAEDAIVLDNSRMTINQQMEWVREIIIKTGNDNRN